MTARCTLWKCEKATGADGFIRTARGWLCNHIRYRAVCRNGGKCRTKRKSLGGLPGWLHG